MEVFRLRLNCIDHYQATPSELDPDFGIDQKQKYKVPIIRVFGATETGQKVCAHVHGFFPYLYVDYVGSLKQADVDVYIQRFRLSVDHALAISYRRDQEGTKTAFVAHITLVKGVPFYGYHVGYRPYLKVYLLNPLHITRLADLLRQGAVMGMNIQPYESHMQYVPQWMSDYNLYGCAYLDCEKPMFRTPIPSVHDLHPSQHKWHSLTIPRSALLDDVKYSRQSHCEIEVDICVQDILNRKFVTQRDLHHDFAEAIKPPLSKVKLVPSMETLWRDESLRRRQKMGIVDPDSSPFEPEVLISVSAEPREDSGEWIHEEEYRQEMLRVAAQEMIKAGRQRVTFDDFHLDNSRVDGLKSAFESIEDLFPDNLLNARASQHSLNRTDAQFNGHIGTDVDEVKIRSFGDFGELSDIDELDIPTDPGDITSTPSRAKNDRNSKKIATPNTVRAENDRLAALGIRIAGDFSHTDEDAFEIPDESALSTPTFTPLKSDRKRGLEETPGSAKKRKLFFSASKADTLKDTSFDAPVGPSSSALTTSFETPKASHFNDKMKYVASQVANRLSHPVANNLAGTSTPQCLGQEGINNTTERLNGGGSKTSSGPNLTNGTTTTPSAFPSASQSSNVSDSLPPSAQRQSQHVWCRQYIESFSTSFYCPERKPPASIEVTQDLAAPGRVTQIYKAAHYSNEDDVPERKFQYGGLEYFPGSYTAPYLPEFDPWNESLLFSYDQPMRFPDHKADEATYKQCRQQCSLKDWEIESLPPTRQEVENWLLESKPVQAKTEDTTKRRPYKSFDFTQVAANTQSHNGAKYFRAEEEKKKTSVKHETQYMSVMSLEVHVNTRGTFVPNPEYDEISAVFWRFHDDSLPTGPNGLVEHRAGVAILSGTDDFVKQISQMKYMDIFQEESELDILNRMIEVVRDLDPDIITGFEVHDGSWGYMIERARVKYEWNLCDEFSRVKTDSHGRFGREDDRWGFNQTSTIRITGRHMINIWRAMRSEINLLQYTMENIIFHLFKKRVPHYAFAELTRWWKSGKPNDVAKVLKYFLERTQHDLDILDKNDLVPRTSEQARLLGVDFFSVFSRGSQFKVESLMFRIAKPENFILVSPSRKQVGGQNALECLPLVMEPQSAFYNSPLVVLDFQSLYPSVMIAYNLCYSTFLGRIVDWRGENKMGFTNYDRQAQLLELLKDHINIAPNGMMYCKPHIRKSLLAKMLGEILETRVMVKSGMKKDKDDKPLQRLLNNRQLALKFIANVTYGYTSASFSGRMPCSEIADSIVQTGRETLEKAIMLIHSVEKWGAEVVYGDTDSLFIYLKGRTRDQAFVIGQEIADSITAVNPKPVKLKFEKVYHPCVLLAKKRYVGFKYEHRKQKEPEFDAKGIETVRRDGTPAEQRIEEKALKLLFRTQDLSQIKQYFQKQCSKIMRGNVSIQDFCFAKEVKLGTYSDKGQPPPGALISTRRMLEDPRAEPQYGERVPYVVVTGAPGARLIDRCVAPEELLRSPHLELDADYYISKNLIPPLERIFNLVGGNVRAWYDEMPKFQRVRSVPIGASSTTANAAAVAIAAVAAASTGGGRNLMESYMRRTACVVCGRKLQQPARDANASDSSAQICINCRNEPSVALLAVRTRLNRAEKEVAELETLCRSCAGLRLDDDVKCDSKACPVFYSRTRHKSALDGTRGLLEPAAKMLEDLEATAE